MTTLTSSGPIASTAAGQIIEGKKITATTGHAITITHNNVIVRNCQVLHKSGHGIFVNGGDDVTIDTVEVINSEPPPGMMAETSANIINIHGSGAQRLRVNKVRLKDGSSGIYLVSSPGATITDIEGFNFRGPMPRGQMVQFNASGGGSIDRFYCHNDPTNSWPEDIISVFKSPNVKVSNGLVVGNNSVTGVGVMFEYSSTGGRVFDVDAVKQANGAFSSYNGDVHFTRCRAFDSIAIDQGRGLPSSGSLQFNLSAYGIHMYDCWIARRSGGGGNVWKTSNAVVLEYKVDDTLQPKARPVNLEFPWEAAAPLPGPEPQPTPTPTPAPETYVETDPLATPRLNALEAAHAVMSGRMTDLEVWVAEIARQANTGPGKAK